MSLVMNVVTSRCSTTSGASPAAALVFPGTRHHSLKDTIQQPYLKMLTLPGCTFCVSHFASSLKCETSRHLTLALALHEALAL
eukprot:7942-Heterococcus_DN1.PRE.3